MSEHKPLPLDFYRRDTLVVARDLIGCVLHRRTSAGVVAGIITETEAYCGPADDASHSAKGRTARTDVMFGPAGRSYVYLIYGMWNCLNVVTEGDGEAVLLRAVIPTEGVELMQARRGRSTALTDGPGKLCQAFAITRDDSNRKLTSSTLWIEERAVDLAVRETTRIGIDYAEQGKHKLWRFVAESTLH